MTAKVLTLDNRFWSKVDRRGDAECWEWQAARQKYGHGLFWMNGKQNKAHRLTYEYFVGEIPAGLIIRHKCDNPPCVNPAHLETGTRADNVRDRDSRGRHIALAGEQHGMAKLTVAAVREIRAHPGGYFGFCREIAERFGVSLGTVYQIRSRPYRHWKEAA